MACNELSGMCSGGKSGLLPYNLVNYWPMEKLNTVVPLYSGHYLARNCGHSREVAFGEREKEMH